MNNFRNESPASSANDFASQLRHYVDSKITQGMQGIGRFNEHTGKVDNSITETKSYWMDASAFDWCAQHSKTSSIPPAMYAACMMNTNVYSDRIVFPTRFRAEYAKRNLGLAGYNLSISKSLKP